MADTGASVTGERCKEKYTDDEAQFLMIDYGEQLAHELEEARNELHKQVTSVVRKVNLLWEVVRAMIVFTVPILTGIGISFLSKTYLPQTLSVISSTVCNGITVGLVFLNLTPLNEAISNYLDSRVYTPNFVKCKCKTCHDKNNCSNEKQEQKNDTAGYNTTSELQELKQDTVTNPDDTNEQQGKPGQSQDTATDTENNNTSRKATGDNQETLKRFVSEEHLDLPENTATESSVHNE